MLRPNSQYCEIKDIIYPNNNNNYYSSNIFNKKNNKYLANNPFKITEIQNINNDYDNLIENDNNFNYDKKQRPLSSTNFIHKNYAIVGSKIKNENIDNNNNNNNFDSMFDKYYQNKLNQKNFKIINNNNNNNIETILNQNKNNNFKSQFLIENISNNNNNNENNNNENNNNENNNNNNISNTNIKPSNKTILKKNFVLENKKILSDKYKIPSHVKPPKPKENPFHKSYGKTPKYIQNMKIAQEFKKEIENKLKEEKNYPKGTRLLSENERIKTLNGLNESKKELLEQIEKLPISMRTVAVNHKRDELFKKLDEIEDAIKMFERKKVFVKIEKNI